MRVVVGLLAIGALALPLGACSSSNSAPAGAPDASLAGDAGAPDAAPACDPAKTADTGDLPEAVNAVLKDKCQACHSAPPRNHAPFPLVSFEDARKIFGLTTKQRWQRMAEVIEPGGLPHMPYRDAPPLTDAELTTLRSWFAACAPPIPEGTGHDLSDDGGLNEGR